MIDLFKNKASDWDANSRRQNLSKGIAECILKNVPLTVEMSVLDFGAGTGLITYHLAPYVGKILAIDVSESMLQQLALKIELDDKVSPLCHDITKAPLNLKFDLIVSAMAMHHVEDTDNMVEQLAKHLNPGGIVALADLDSEDGSFHSKESDGVFHNGFDRHEFQQKLKKYGFTDIWFETAYTVQSEAGNYPIFLVVAKKY